MSAKRNSNIELLRIFAMLGIVLQHCVAHNTVDYKFVYQTNYFCGLILEWSMLGRLGVAIFILIFGYFSINQKFRISRCFVLGIEVWTYSIVTYLALFFFRLIHFNFSDFFHSLMPILFQKYWFISAYIIFYLISPIINKSLNSLTKKQFKYIIAVLLILWCIIPSLSFNHIFNYCYELEQFFLLYCIGAYLRNWSSEGKKRIHFVLSIFGGISMYIISPIILNTLGLKISFFSDLGNAFFYRTSIPTVMIAYGLLGIMSKKSIKSNRIINTIAGTIFGIYLFHFSIIDVLLKQFFPIDKYIDNPIYLLLYLSAITISIFFVSFIVELLRKQIEKIYKPSVIKISDRLQTKIVDCLP